MKLWVICCSLSETEEWDGTVFITSNYYAPAVGAKLYRTKEQAQEESKKLIADMWADYSIYSIDGDCYPDNVVCDYADGWEYPEDATIGAFCEWAESNGVDPYPHLPYFVEIRTLEFDNNCKKQPVAVTNGIG